MRCYTLLLIDTSGIQDYIFGSNQLRQNVGASYLVDSATGKWVVEALPEPNNVGFRDGEEIDFREDKRIEEGSLKAEVIYLGGGNALIIFADDEEAARFSQRFTRKVLLKAPGLNVRLSRIAFEWNKDPLGGPEGKVQEIMDQLSKKKRERVLPVTQLGLGVTAACTFTDLPAIDEITEEGRSIPISAEVKAKLEAEKEAHARLIKLVDWHNFEVPKDLDDFGRTRGESSYIAIVHIDGNNMGKRIKVLREQFIKPEQNRGYIDRMRKFSRSVHRTALEILNETVESLVSAVTEGEEKGEKRIGDIKLSGNKLPFRPIVYGGDDVTFVTDGRLGLSLSAYYLQRLASKTLEDGRPLYARAGIAVVKTHYPFARAYALAEELCASAKKYIQEIVRDSQYMQSFSAMDWHFATSGPLLRLDDIRKREYEPPAGKLYMRPICVTDQGEDWRSWATLTRVIKYFSESEEWAGRRNKVKALRDALRAGPDAVRNFLQVYKVTLPPIEGLEEMTWQGWQGDRCGYFDAIEAIDFYIPLEGGGA